MVDDFYKGSRSSDDLENVYDRIQNLETTGGSDNIGDDNSVNQDDTLTLRSIEKGNDDLAGGKTLNCKQPRTEKQLGASASEIVNNTKGLEKAVSPVCPINIKIYATLFHAMNSQYYQYKELLNVIECELKNTLRASNVAVPPPVVNVPKKATDIDKTRYSS